jgi:tetratricopeptide (TPR) repeat protein
MIFRQNSRRFFGRLSAWLLIFSLLSPVTLFAQTTKVPDDVRKIYKKMSNGQELTPAEQKRIEEFQAGKSEAELERIAEELEKDADFRKEVDAAKKESEESEEEPLPQPNPKVNLARETAPVEAGFLVLVKAVQSESGAKIKETEKAEIDKAVSQLKNAAQISNLGMIYLMSDKPEEVSKAVYLAATSVIKDPKDAADISNLGVALKNNEDYARSLKVLLYADKLQTNSPVILSNLGWTLAYLGDFPTAKMRFNAALAFKKDYPNALEGLGILAQAEKDFRTADKYLRANLLRRFSPAGAKAIKKNDEAKRSEKTRQEAEEIKNDPNTYNPKPVPPGAPVNPESVDGARWSDAIWSPFDKPSQTFERLPVPDFINGDIETAHREGKNDKDYYLARRAVVSQESAAFTRAMQSLPDDVLRPQPRVEGNSIVFPRSYEKEFYALRDLENVFYRRSAIRFQNFDKQRNYIFALSQDWNGAWTKGISGAEVCRRHLRYSLGNHATYYQNWQEFYQKSLDDMDKFYRASAFWIQRIVNPQLREYANLRRDVIIRLHYHHLLASWGSWSSFIRTTPCEQVDNPQSRWTVEQLVAKNGKLKIFAEPNGDCHVPTGNVDAGFIALDADCEKLKITFGAGAKISLERKFGEKEADDVTTFRIAGGISKSLDINLKGETIGSIEGKAEGSYFIQAQNGRVIDHGAEGTIGVEGKIGDADVAEIVINAGLDGRITAQSGAKVSAKETSVEIGGKGIDYINDNQPIGIK